MINDHHLHPVARLLAEIVQQEMAPLMRGGQPLDFGCLRLQFLLENKDMDARVAPQTARITRISSEHSSI